MRKTLSHAFALWVPFVIALTGVFLLVSWSVQQNYRQGANDPQIQMAEDAAALLTQNDVPAAVVPRTNPQSAGAPTVDLATSLAPWIAVYDASGTPLESSGVLGGAPPRLPQGVFDTNQWSQLIIGHHLNSQPASENRFTWQPAPNVRQAVVLVQFSSPRGSGYVAVGRNLREVENRETTLMRGTAVLWGATSLATLVAICVLLALGWL